MNGLFSVNMVTVTLFLAPIMYRVTHVVDENLPLTYIWVVPPSCLGSR